MGPIFCIFPAIMMSSTCTDTKNLVSDDRTFIPNLLKLLRIVFPKTNPRSWMTVQEVPRDLQSLPMIWAICCGRRIHTSEHSDLGILSTLGTSSKLGLGRYCTSCTSRPSQPGNLAITSIIFGNGHLGRKRALIRKTAEALESSFALCHQNTTPHS